MTTKPNLSTGGTLPDISTPASWMQTPDETLLENFEPFYSVINNFIDDWDMPRPEGWIGVIILLCFVLGIGAYMVTKGVALSLGVVTVVMAGAIVVHLLPSFFWYVVIMFAMGTWSLRPSISGGI